MILSELCVLKWTCTSEKVAQQMCKLKTICTDLLCWIYFVPLCSGSGDEALSLYKCQQAWKNETQIFKIM